MQQLLMSLSLCLLGFAVCVLIFAAANRGEEEEESKGKGRSPTRKGEFFLDEVSPPPSGSMEPAVSLLLRLRAHVRSEHEAAKAFLDLPTADSLHAPTDSPPWH